MIKILIVDNSPDIRTMLELMLGDEGYDARGLANSDTGVEVYFEQPPDLLIIDVWLEGSKLCGIEMLEEMWRRRIHVPVVMISAHVGFESASSTFFPGVVEFIEKPFSSNRLLLGILRGLNLVGSDNVYYLDAYKRRQKNVGFELDN